MDGNQINKTCPGPLLPERTYYSTSPIQVSSYKSPLPTLSLIPLKSSLCDVDALFARECASTLTVRVLTCPQATSASSRKFWAQPRHQVLGTSGAPRPSVTGVVAHPRGYNNPESPLPPASRRNILRGSMRSSEPPNAMDATGTCTVAESQRLRPAVESARA